MRIEGQHGWGVWGKIWTVDRERKTYIYCFFLNVCDMVDWPEGCSSESVGAHCRALSPYLRLLIDPWGCCGLKLFETEQTLLWSAVNFTRSCLKVVGKTGTGQDVGEWDVWGMQPSPQHQQLLLALYKPFWPVRLLSWDVNRVCSVRWNQSWIWDCFFDQKYWAFGS